MAFVAKQSSGSGPRDDPRWAKRAASLGALRLMLSVEGERPARIGVFTKASAPPRLQSLIEARQCAWNDHLGEPEHLVERLCAPLVKPNRIDSPIVRHGGLESRGEVACGREPVWCLVRAAK
jgi:hypothetical protein